MLMVTFPVFWSVTVWLEEVFPAFIPPKASDVGVKDATGACPVPVSDTLFGLLAAFVVNVRFADLAPPAAGVKTTLTVQPFVAGRELPQLELEIEKSPGFVPVKAMLEIASVPVPVFVRFTA